MAAAIGAAAAVGADALALRIVPRHRVTAAAGGLVTAAAIYPLARRRTLGDDREKAVLVAAAVVALGPAALSPKAGRALIAVGWLAHAGFDASFHAGADSRIPRWYPAMCAGYDAALAVRLARV